MILCLANTELSRQVAQHFHPTCEISPLDDFFVSLNYKLLIVSDLYDGGDSSKLEPFLNKELVLQHKLL